MESGRPQVQDQLKLYDKTRSQNEMIFLNGWGCSLMVKNLSTIGKSLDSIPDNTHTHHIRHIHTQSSYKSWNSGSTQVLGYIKYICLQYLVSTLHAPHTVRGAAKPPTGNAWRFLEATNLPPLLLLPLHSFFVLLPQIGCRYLGVDKQIQGLSTGKHQRQLLPCHQLYVCLPEPGILLFPVSSL